MEPFSIATGIIGLLSAVDGIINLCSRCVDLARGGSAASHPELLTRMRLVLSTLQEVRSRVESDQASSPQKKSEMLAYLAELRIMMSKFQKRLKYKYKWLLLGYSKLENDLSSIEKFVSGLVQLLSIRDMAAAEAILVSQLPFNETLARVLQNLKSMDMKAMAAAGVYRKDRTMQLDPSDRFKEEGEQASIVEAISVGPNHAERDARRTRILTVVHFLRDLSSPFIPHEIKVVEGRDYFYCISVVKPGSKTLESSLAAVQDKGKQLEVLLSVANVLKDLHDMLILHKDINGYNVILSNMDHSGSSADMETYSVQLVGFVSARISLQRTDGYSCASDAASERRRAIFTAPEKAQGVPYTAQCDIFSFGVLAMEVCLGTRLVELSPTVHTAQDVLALIAESSPLLDLAQDCINPYALARPDAREIVTRLLRLTTITSTP